MALIHIVLFQFKANVDSETVQKAISGLLALKDSCLHPETQQPYIKSLTGGKDNSPEGLQNGIQYAFVVEFESTSDRDYYTKMDPVHQAYIQSIGALAEKVIVVDYTAGVF